MPNNVRATRIACAIVLSTAPAQASAMVSYELTARVPVVCSIDNATVISNPSGNTLLRVVTHCNAQSYSLVMGGGLVSTEIENAQTSNGSVHASGAEFRIHARRPGRAETVVHLNGKLDSALAPTLQLIASS